MSSIKTQLRDGAIFHVSSQEFSYILGYVSPKKKLVTCFDVISHVMGTLQQGKPPEFFFKAMLKADKLVTISEFMKEEIIKYFDFPREDIFVVYEGVDHESYKKIDDSSFIRDKYNIPKDKKIVLNVGSETPTKNIPFLINAFKKVKEDCKDSILIKIGKPQRRGGREKLLALVKKCNLEKDIIIIDNVPEEDLPLFYNEATVSVAPNLYEGGPPLPAIEAIACGCPLVCSDIPAIRETIEDGVLLVDPHNIETGAASICEILKNENLASELSKKGIKTAKNFSWKKTAKGVLEVYQSF